MKSEIILSRESQRTIKSPRTYTGIGLHFGKKTTIKFKPGRKDTGIVFCRTDLKGNPKIPATLDYVIETKRRTKLGNKNATIEPTEHVLSAVRGLGIDNLIIEVNGSEIPITDGSAAIFVDILQKSGFKSQDAKRKYLVVNEPISISFSEHHHLTVFPNNYFKVDYRYDYKNVRSHSALTDLAEFPNLIAPSRTFCFDDELKYLNRLGLIKGINKQNVIVIDDEKNPSIPLRYHDEYSKHKILDFIGDSALLGIPIKGSFIVSHSGHRTNFEFMKKIRDSIKYEK